MQTVKRSFSGAPWETEVAYCRSIRYGNHISVSGTAPINERGETYAAGNAYEQTKRCLALIEKSLGEWGAGLPHVVRTRLFVTDISRWREFAKAHQEAFRDSPPATSMIEVKSLINPEMLIEIEAEAFFSAGD